MAGKDNLILAQAINRKLGKVSPLMTSLWRNRMRRMEKANSIRVPAIVLYAPDGKEVATYASVKEAAKRAFNGVLTIADVKRMLKTGVSYEGHTLVQVTRTVKRKTQRRYAYTVRLTLLQRRQLEAIALHHGMKPDAWIKERLLQMIDEEEHKLEPELVMLVDTAR